MKLQEERTFFAKKFKNRHFCIDLYYERRVELFLHQFYMDTIDKGVENAVQLTERGMPSLGEI